MGSTPRSPHHIRIIAGAFRSRQLAVPGTGKTRPTGSRTREALFSLLESRYLPAGFDGLDVLDLFAGSGALGLEALSRGASALQAIEHDRAAVQALRDNCRQLDVLSRTKITKTHLPDQSLRLQQPPHIIFCDPPYALDATEIVENIAEQVRPDAILCYEHQRDARPVLPNHWLLCTRRTWGIATVSIFRRQPHSPSMGSATNRHAD